MNRTLRFVSIVIIISSAAAVASVIIIIIIPILIIILIPRIIIYLMKVDKPQPIKRVYGSYKCGATMDAKSKSRCQHIFHGGGFTRGFTGKIHLARCFLRGRSVSGDKNKQTNSGTNKRTDGHRHRAEPSLLRRGFNKIQIKLNKLPCSLQHSDNKVTLSYNSKY